MILLAPPWCKDSKNVIRFEIEPQEGCEKIGQTDKQNYVNFNIDYLMELLVVRSEPDDEGKDSRLLTDFCCSEFLSVFRLILVEKLALDVVGLVPIRFRTSGSREERGSSRGRGDGDMFFLQREEKIV